MTESLLPVESREFTAPDIFVPLVPKHLTLTQGMIEDFICRPDLAVKVIFKEELDAFSSARIKLYTWIPRVMDSSGFSSFKTRDFFKAFALRCILIGDHHAGVYYQNFSAGQKNFWQYFDVFMRKSDFFRAQIGKMDVDDDRVSKGTNKGPSCWTVEFRNQSKLFLPAPAFLTDSANQAGMRFNDLGVDEWTKIEASGSTGIDDQLIGRCTRESYNKHHPFWRNHNLFLATAEDMMHPAYRRYQQYEREVKKGNPDYALIAFNYKDISDLPYGNSTFREKLRDDLTYKDMKIRKGPIGFLQEGIGIWSHNGRGWYDIETLDRCVEIGKAREVYPLIRRDEPGALNNDRVHYFLGIDPAKADKKKADDGAMMIMRAISLTEDAGDNINDWQLDFVWAYKVRKADATQWASLVHMKNCHFKFHGVMLDHGGGGQWIKPELAKAQQVINDQRVTVIPITTIDDTSVALSNPCLTMFTKSDDLISRKWETIKGDDNLIDIAHTEFLEAMLRGRIGFPPTYQSIDSEIRAKWGSERMWASRLIDKARVQLSTICVATDENGVYLMTRNNAKQFEAKGRKDFAYAAVHAFTRFLVWLKTSDREYLPSEEDACQCE